jgi:hypothetical protein
MPYMKKANAYKVLVGKPEVKGPFGRPNVDAPSRNRMGWCGLETSSNLVCNNAHRDIL